MDLPRRLADFADAYAVPGAAVAYSVAGDVTEAAAGVLNRNTGVAATPDSLFKVASVTKLWTATLAHQLVDEGTLDLDRPVRAYLPDFRLVDESVAATVTTADLLRHTTGFVGDIFDDHGRGDDALGEYVAGLAAAPAIAAPGELFSYCNSGYCLLGHLVATLRGMTWEEAMRRYLIEPLGLTRIALFAEEAILHRVAAGHLVPEDGTEPAVHPQWQMPRSVAPAGGTLCTTPRTLLDFARLFLDGGRPDVLSADAVARAWEPHVAVPGDRPTDKHWGLGWTLFDWDGTRAFGHDGGLNGQSSCLRIVPEADFAIVAMVNGGAGEAGLFDGLVRPLVGELIGVSAPAAPTPPAAPAPVDAAPYLGDFVDPLRTYRIEPDDGALLVTDLPSEYARSMGKTESTIRYVHLSGDTFIATEPAGGTHPLLTFVRTDGEPAKYLHNGRAFRRSNPMP